MRRPRYLLFGDQNGDTAPSVPSRGVARANRAAVPNLQMALVEGDKASVRPSGESAILVRCSPNGIRDPGGGAITKRVTLALPGFDVRHGVNSVTMATVAAMMITLDNRSERRGEDGRLHLRVSEDPALATHSSSRSRSRAVCQRSSGSLAIHRSTMWSSAGGNPAPRALSTPPVAAR